jgi:hypothetical protein
MAKNNLKSRCADQTAISPNTSKYSLGSSLEIIVNACTPNDDQLLKFVGSEITTYMYTDYSMGDLEAIARILKTFIQTSITNGMKNLSEKHVISSL